LRRIPIVKLSRQVDFTKRALSVPPSIFPTHAVVQTRTTSPHDLASLLDVIIERDLP
jgi:hypothetical protein